MTCYSPLKGYRAQFVNENGKRPIVFNVNQGFKDLPVEVPCGQCWGCRLEYSRQWAIRCVHESQMHTENSFITLTYNEENLPDDHSIHKEELQKFFKRLRKRIGKKIRYFACGEYGDKNNRPHYHAIIFGYDFPDKVLRSKTPTGNLLFESELLSNAWQNKGWALIGDVTFESAAYVARYVMKKRKGDDQEKYYELLDTESGEIHNLEPEFCLMSRRPGIGRTWLEKYKSDTDKDFITLRGKKLSLPKYYDSILEIEDELGMNERKAVRRSMIKPEETTFARLRVREEVKKAQTNQLKRGFENET